MNSPDADALSDRRRRRRHRLSSDINVIDQLRETKIGQLVNLHQEGLMIFGQELSIHATLQISLDLPNSINDEKTCTLGIECLWSQAADIDQPLYWTGCSIIDKSPNAEACIEKLIGFRSKE